MKNNSSLFINYTKQLLSILPQRQREIIEKRFGLFNNKRATLQAIGSKYHITRERIRQIENEVIKNLSKVHHPKEFYQLIKTTKKFLQKNGGFCEENLLYKNLKQKYSEDIPEAIFSLWLTIDGSLYFSKENKIYKSFWALSKNYDSLIKDVVKQVQELLEKTKKPLSLENILANISSNKPIDKKTLENILIICKNFDKNPLGEYGLVRWATIRPVSTRDKGYYFMKYNVKKPIHFRQLCSLLSNYNFPNKRKINVQTVHNELIRDPRFVLIGHGIYALQEWGYNKGTAKDVVYTILQTANKPLSFNDIVREVKKQRLVKDNTIRFILRDKQFQKTPDGKYTINKAYINTSETDNEEAIKKQPPSSSGDYQILSA